MNISGKVNRKALIDLMFHVSSKDNAFDILEQTLQTLDRNAIETTLIECGVLPEVFEHDSSEEKLWAKYTDILLARALGFIGMDSQVMRTRGDSADVFAKTKNYSLVADAKTFRLSRTAKNQKDFKVNALNDWRRKDTYALLVGPLSQYPTNSSQIYAQAIALNVTLFSYVQLNLIMESGIDARNLTPIWEIGKALSKALPTGEKKSAERYWAKVDSTVCEVLGKSEAELSAVKAVERKTTQRLGNEGINFWKAEIEKIRTLSKNEAIERLIAAQKIPQKITQIEKAVTRALEL